MFLLALICASFSGASPSIGSPSPQVEILEVIQSYLGSIDTAISPEQWKGLGVDAIPILESIAQSPKVFPSRRAKAITGLASFGNLVSQTTAQFLMRTASDENEVFAVRRSALDAFCEVTKKEQVPDNVTPLMKQAADHRIRLQAAQLLVRHAPFTSCSSVQIQSGREKAELRDRWQPLLSACNKL